MVLGVECKVETWGWWDWRKDWLEERSSEWCVELLCIPTEEVVLVIRKYKMDDDLEWRIKLLEVTQVGME